MIRSLQTQSLSCSLTCGPKEYENDEIGSSQEFLHLLTSLLRGAVVRAPEARRHTTGGELTESLRRSILVIL